MYKINFLGLFFCLTMSSIAQTFDLNNSRDAYKINEMDLNSFELYYTYIFDMFGKTYRNPTVEKETNGAVNYSERIRNQGVLKEEWRNYPVYFHGIHLEESITSRNISGINNELPKEIVDKMKFYFKNDLDFLQVQDNITLTTIKSDVLKGAFFRPEVVNEASQLLTKSNF